MRALKKKEHGDLFTLSDWLAMCDAGGFIDYDGYGYPVFGDKVDEDFQVWPSERANIPDQVTHILWFNR